MSTPAVAKNRRILVVDDNRAIHEDFRKILCSGASARKLNELEAAEAALFAEPAVAGNKSSQISFEVDSALQGQEALVKVQEAERSGRPYAMAFVDVRMPPGWDGIETAARLWKACPDLQIVICTAYSDYSWDEMTAKLNISDQLVILKKPFDTVEVLQLTCALTEKWRLQQEAQLKLEHLEALVQERTHVLKKTNARLEDEIAERQRAADALRESEERYQLLFQKNPLPMWVVDLETLSFLAVNETAVRQYGYTKEQFASMTVKDVRIPEELASVEQHLTESRQADVNTFTTRHHRKDGSIIDVEVIANAIPYAGRPAKLALASDITARKAAQDRIREQALLLDLAHDAIFVRDMTGNISYWNKGAESLYGWTATEAVGKPAKEIFAGEEAVSPFELAERILLENGEWSGEWSKTTRNGRKITIDSRWTLLRDPAGKPRSVLVIEADVTDKKRLETQFLRAQRMEGIGTLATGMAHDLNNILAPILISAGTLRWDLGPEERDDAINHIEGGVKRGAEIIRQVLTFGRGVEGERVAVSPPELLKEVVTMIGQTFPKDITFSHEAEPDVWPIIGDKTQIHQVLLNLCINARDSMPAGGRVSLHVRNIMVDENYPVVHTSTRPGPYVAFEIRDTGCGIPAADLERIFDPFFTTKELGKGTGLGLSTVLGIVKSHHGLISVESELKRGTTFRVLFPVALDTVRNIIPQTFVALPRSGGEVVLFVDDEVNIVAANRRMLEKHGYKVFAASDGREALEIFRRNHHLIKVVVTDVMMPGMDGLALVRALRMIDPNVRIIASSGLGSGLGSASGGGRRALELKSLGVAAFLAKPYTTEKLLTVLHQVSSQSQPAGFASATGQPRLSTA